MNIDRLCPGCMNDNGGENVCSVCGYDMSSKNDSSFLPVRFFLSERYVIGKAIAVNTEGVTYIAWDNASNSAVHIKEYFPKGISVRNPDKTVSVIGGKEFNFNEGLMSFIDTNKKLIATELQSIIPVLTVFEENGTVYAVMPIISGITLGSFLERNGGSLRWEQARPLFLPLIDTIKGLHDIGIIHGGISTETIIVGRDGKLRLGGICIPQLRMVSQDSPTELYNGYAAVEQYGKVDASLSAASDVYALSAVLFRVLIGTVPPSSESRIVSDTLSVPARFADELPRQVLVAIANGMQIRVHNRTGNIEKFKNELVYGETPENLRRASNNRDAVKKTEQVAEKPAKKKGGGAKNAVIAAVITLLIFLILAGVLLYVFKDTIFGGLFGKQDDTTSDINSSKPIVTSSASEEEEDLPPADPTKTYMVPDLIGQYYGDLTKDKFIEEFGYDNFVIKQVEQKVYSNAYERGKICAQSIPAGQEVPGGTEILVTVSLGPKEFEMPDFCGSTAYTSDEVVLELLKMGFMFENIDTTGTKAVPDKENGIVVEQYPAAGEMVSADDSVKIYINISNAPEEGEDGQPEQDQNNLPGNDVNY